MDSAFWLRTGISVSSSRRQNHVAMRAVTQVLGGVCCGARFALVARRAVLSPPRPSTPIGAICPSIAVDTSTFPVWA